MDNLFKKGDADFYYLVDYVDTFLNSECKNFNLFQLPPIQRNFVWNIAQIERLWDSVLRGYPIGSLLVSPRNKEAKARDLYTGKQVESEKDGYFLLDGQQRTRALLLGFKPNENARLWIDLNPNIIFDNIDLNDRKFLLRVLTSYQPWGMSDRNPSDKLNENQKFSARQEINIEQLHYDYQVKIDVGDNNFAADSYSWPLRARLPIPLDKLIALCGGTSGKFNKPEWKLVCELIPERYHNAGQVPEMPTNHYELIIERLKLIIDTTSDLSKPRTIVLLLQNEENEESNESVQDNMEVLFRRINAGGTTLQGEEMSYFLLKSSWDGAYEMVSNILNDKGIGYLLSSTSIVMAATRIVRFVLGKSDISNPSVGNFRRWIGEKEEGATFLTELRKILITNNFNQSILHEIIGIFCAVVLYREHDKEDIGLPKKLLLSIKPLIYHPVFIWIYQNDCNKEIAEKNRENILRYLVYCYLTVEKNDKASKHIIELLRKNHYTYFPDKEIYELLLDEELSKQLPNISDFSKPFEVPVDGFFRHWNDLFNIPDDNSNAFRHIFWDSINLLLWFQREYSAKWFKGYDPTSNDAYDTPYDSDHIMPYSHIISSGASANIYSDNKELNDKFFRNRGLYVNSIGNKRLWPFWANRAESNQCHTYKLRMEDPSWEKDIIAKELGLSSVEDFLRASFIPLVDDDLWYNAGGEVRDWPTERRNAWQAAVEKRILFLYEYFYTKFHFENWNE